MQNMTKEIQVLTSEQQPLIALAEKIVVENSEQCTQAVEYSGQAKDALNKIEKTRLSFTKPINEGLTNINKMFKQVSTPLAMAASLIDGAIHKYRAVERKRREVEAAKIQAEEDLVSKFVYIPAYLVIYLPSN